MSFCDNPECMMAISGLRASKEQVLGSLLNLLAVIHRDGGHHTAKVGLGASVADATALVLSLRSDLDEVRGQVISGAYMERVPMFRQGYPVHELEEVVTAAEVTGYVSRIESLLGNQ